MIIAFAIGLISFFWILCKLTNLSKFAFTPLYLAVILYIMYMAIRLIYQDMLYASNMFYLLFFFSCYLAGRNLANFKTIQTFFIALALVVFLLCFYCLVFDTSALFEQNVFTDNSSILAIQLSLLLTGCFWLAKKRSSKFWRILFFVLAAFYLFMIFFLGSRTAIIASIYGLSYTLLYHLLLNKFSWKKLLVLATASFIILTIVLAVSIKLDSSTGRCIIWKNTFTLLEQNWLTGVGVGLFNPNYNHIQAEYFSHNSLTNYDAMLANDGYYAFNEFLQFFVEHGLFGLTFLLAIVFLIIRGRLRGSFDKQGLIIALLIVVCISCLFSYPLHNWTIAGLVIFLSGYLSRQLPSIKVSSIILKYMSVSLVAIMFLFFLFLGYIQLNAQRDFKKAKEVYEEGSKTEAYLLSKKTASFLKTDYSFTLFYTNLLYQTGRVEEAINWFHKYHHFHCNEKAHSLMGKCYDELRNFKMAEQHFLSSLFITPHLLESRLNLMALYHGYGNKTQATYWAKQILETPVKNINNRQANSIRAKAQAYLNNF